MKFAVEINTFHSWKPCILSGFHFLIATAIPVQELEGARVFSSTQTLKTLPKPPSPNTESGLKFLVAVFKSVKLNPFKLGASKIFPSGYESSTLILLAPTENWLLQLLLLVLGNCVILLEDVTIKLKKENLIISRN